MCTVTIVPKGENDFILTSNRDESPNRIPIIPEFYYIDSTEVLFPKDNLSGGSWIGVSEKKRVVCLLNGGFEIHERRPNYRLSRGIVVKDFILINDINNAVLTYNFEDIEPFTMVIADWNIGLKFFELVWDGEEVHFTELPLEPKIWSSSTLYNSNMRKERSEWFKVFKSQSALEAASIMQFHKTAGQGNNDYGVVMDRGVVKTTSITQIEKENDAVELQYYNLQDKKQVTRLFKLPQIVNG